MPEVERAKISTVAASIHLIKAVMGAGRFIRNRIDVWGRLCTHFEVITFASVN